MRDKLSDSFVTEKDADALRSQLTAVEDWLYDEGEDAEKPVYEQRLAELRKLGDPIIERYREFEARKPAFEAFDRSIIRVRKAYEDYVAGGEAHAHIDSADMEKVINAIEENKRWIDDARHRQERRAKTEPPIVFANEIAQKQQAFEAIVMPILNKKKPAPPPQNKETKNEASPSPNRTPGDNAAPPQQAADNMEGAGSTSYPNLNFSSNVCRPISMVEEIEGSKSYHDVILTETMKRKEILLDLSATRNPEANRKKFKAWKEIQEIVLVQCDKTMTIAQIKRVWRSKKASMRDVLRRQKLRQLLDGGCDLSLENSIVEVSPALTEAEIQLARRLVQEDVMRGQNNTAIYDKGGVSDSSESTLEDTRKGWKDDGHGGSRMEEDGGRGRKDPTVMKGHSFVSKRKRRREDSSDFSESASEGTRGWRGDLRAERSAREEDGRKKKKGSSGRKRSVWDSDSSESVMKSTKRGHKDDGWARKRRRRGDERREEADSRELIDRHELRRIRRKRVLQQLEDFDTDCSSSAESVSDKAIIELQMKVLREEEELIAKKSLALDIYVDVLRKQQEFYTSVLKRFEVSTEEKPSNRDPQQQQTLQCWNLAPYSALPPDLKSTAAFL
ncbi:unnamed protein product [Cylicocyclus nassatus]|uniref:Regulatory protein zeste n=1 Tax=Cylicocyclus nassatus TaxID=53992 RepID=A0AA36DU66_CYLNA|nr:unnamed protein product [Cylicocyclus nassatus]